MASSNASDYRNYSATPTAYYSPYNTQPQQQYQGTSTGYNPEYPAMNYSGYYNSNIDSSFFQQPSYREGFVHAPSYAHSQPEEYTTRSYKIERKKRREEKRSRNRNEKYYTRKTHRRHYDDSGDDSNGSVYVMKPVSITKVNWSFFNELNSKLKFQGQLLNRLVFAEMPMIVKIVNSTKKTLEIRDIRILWYFLGAYDSYKVHQYMEGKKAFPQSVLSLIATNDQARCKEIVDRGLKAIKTSPNSYEHLIHVSKNRMITDVNDIDIDNVCLEASVMKQPTASFYSSAEKETINVSNVGKKCCFLQMASMEHKWYTLGYTFRNNTYLYKHPRRDLD